MEVEQASEFEVYPVILSVPSIFSVNHLLYLGVLLFTIGLFGTIFNKNNALILLMALEILLLGISLSLISFGIFFKIPQSFVFALLLLSLAAAESAIGLSILVSYHRLKGNIFLDSANLLKG